MKFGPALEVLTQKAWALEPGVLGNMARVFVRHAQGDRLSRDEIQAAVAASRASRGQAAGVDQSPGFSVAGGVAIVPIYGIIAKRASMLNGSSQPRGTSCEVIRQNLAAAVDDPEIHAILLDVDSPGGSVDGVADAADAIFNARKQKLVVAYADGMMCSAAYFMASQASEIYGGKTALVGSIGVYSVWLDSSEAAEKEGCRVIVVRSGDLKGAGVDGAPITDKHVEKFQRTVDAFAEIFRTAVAVGRDMSEAAVAKLADGDVLVGRHAVDAGLMDAVKSFEQVLADLRARRADAGARAMQAGRSGRAGKMDGESSGSPGQEVAQMPNEKKQSDAERLGELKAAFQDDPAFVLEQFERGRGLTEAKAEMADRLAVENKQLKADAEAKAVVDAEKAKADESKAKADEAKAKAAALGNKALTEGSGQVAEGEGDGSAREKFDCLVAAELARGVQRYAAVASVSRRQPDLRQAMLAEVNPGLGGEVDRVCKM